MSKQCKSCGAEIEWAVTAGGKKMPVDAEPVPGGNLVLDRSRRPYGVRHLADGEGSRQLSFNDMTDGEVLGYVSHFVTCPQRREWRKPQRSERRATV